MSYMLEIFGRALPDSLWPVFRDYLGDWGGGQTQKPSGRIRCGDNPHVLAGVAALQHTAAGQAKLHFDRAFASKQRTPAAVIGMACALDMMGQPDRARRYLKLLMEQFPEDAKLHYAMGLLQERAGQTHKALPLYQHSIYFQPHQRSSRFRLMALALAGGDYQAALPQAEALCGQYPLELPAWTRLGALQLVTDDPARAIRSFDKALQLLADNWRREPDSQMDPATGEDAASEIEHLEESVTEGADSADLHVRLGDLYARQGRGDEALEEYKQALRANPYYLEATAKVAAVYVHRGAAQQGATWLGRALDINETLLMAYVGTALASAYIGKDTESRDNIEMARGIASNAPVLMAEIARMHIAAHDPDVEPAPEADAPREVRTAYRAELLQKAIQIHLAWLTQNQDDASTWLRLGMLLEADNQLDSANQAYQKTLEIHPGCTFALVRLGLSATGCDAPTSGLLRRAFWPEKIDMRTQYDLSVLFSQSHRFELTVETFGESLGEEQHQSFWRNVALSLEQMGMLNRPKCLWQTLTEISATPVSSAHGHDAGGGRRKGG